MGCEIKSKTRTVWFNQTAALRYVELPAKVIVLIIEIYL